MDNLNGIKNILHISIKDITNKKLFPMFIVYFITVVLYSLIAMKRFDANFSARIRSYSVISSIIDSYRSLKSRRYAIKTCIYIYIYYLSKTL